MAGLAIAPADRITALLAEYGPVCLMVNAHTCGPFCVEQYLVGKSTGKQLNTSCLQGWPQIGVGGGPAPAFPDRHISWSEPFLAEAVIICVAV